MDLHAHHAARAATILLIDDDAEIRTLLTEYLGRAGFGVRALPDGSTLMSVLKQDAIDLVVLDIMLPGHDGFTLCRMIRQFSTVPIIMLTAASDEADKVIGLEFGADDYMAKPFSARELLARIKALLRRNQMAQTPASGAEPRYLVFGDWKLDVLRRELLHADGSVEPISGTEYALLSLFLRHAHEVLDRDAISEITRHRENNPLDRGVDVQVSRLRQRLRDGQRELVRAVRNQGYMLCADVRREY
ncbi:response regulator [Jeongeupia sp. USM3]|uniref:response regulator n=1 Tax=Jeongeupia sp. USM3 TaxID=1906741 RepID=UPI00089DD764|nr:response regulator transcription factor [Jeongeupia sp. USM3]AOX99408.1 DNA-binding response regulator [Jeongeupia sp. USM3]